MSDEKNSVADALSLVLADTYQLYLKTHGYHWNVRGSQFNSLHTLFMTQYNEMWLALDLIAERIRALGVLAAMSGSAYAHMSQIKDGDPSLSANEMLSDLKLGHEILIETLKNALETAETHKDAPSVDLLTQRLDAHQKTLWMISVSLET